MSYILEALRRADRDRKLGRAPQADQVAQITSRPVSRSIGPWLVGLNVLVLALIVLWFVNRDDEDATLVTAEAEQELASEPVSQTAPPAVPRDAPATTPEWADTARPDISEAQDEVPADEGQAFGDEPEPWETAIEELDSNVGEPPAPSIEAVMAPEAKPAAPSAPSAGPASRPAPPPPAARQILPLRDMPQEFRQTVPGVKLNTHFYSENPERRFVIIDLNEYREGDKLPEGLALIEIRREGAVLEYRGDRFLLPR